MNENTDYKAIVVANVQAEYNEFYNEELSKSKEEIYDDYYRIHFYEELKEMLIAEDNDCYVSKDNYRCLAADGKSVLSLLYDDYLSCEYASISSWEDISDFICSYNEHCHEDILKEGGSELE